MLVTGHSKGIGNWIETTYNNVIGCSRSNGFCIDNIAGRKRIANLLEENNIDVFVNNAYSFELESNAQIEMLYEAYELWKDKEGKTIINIGSIKNRTYEFPVLYKLKYTNNKKMLNDISKDLQVMSPNLRIITMNPGIAKTEFNKNKTEKMLVKEDFLEVFDFILNTKLFIRQIDFTK